MKNLKRFFAVLGIFVSGVAGSSLVCAQAYNSDWIQVAPGFEEKKIGARVDFVGEVDEDGQVRVEVSFPDSRGKDIEEVIVTARKKKPDKEMKYHVDTEVIKNLEAGRTGIIFYLGQKEDFQVRLNYIDYQQNPHLAPGS